MTIPVLTFFSNRRGVGKTSLVYHLAWMFSEKGKRVLACDLDPQARLTASFLDEDALEALWRGDKKIARFINAYRPGRAISTNRKSA